MAGWDSFPIVKSAAPVNDPWAKFPVVQPQAAAPAAPAAAPPVAAPAGPVVQDPYLADLPIPGTITDAQPAPEKDWLDTIMEGATYGLGTVNQAADGIVRGATNVAGLPVDAINAAPMLANLIPGVDGVGPMSDYPIGGSKSLYDAARMGGIFGDVAEPADPFQRIVRRTGMEIGAAAVPAAGVVAKFGGVGLQAAKEAPSLARLFGAEAAAVNPAAFLGKEAAVATGAGMGAGMLNEATGNQDGSNPWIDAGGALAGAGAVGVGTGIGKSAMDIGRAFFGNGTFQDEVVKEAVMRDLAAAAGITAKPGEAPDLSPLIDQIMSGPKVSDTIPGFTESIADRTRNPGLAALEYSRQGGPNAGTYTQQRASNTEAVDAAMAPLEPTGTPGQFSGELQAQRTARIGEVTTAANQAQTAFDDATRTLLPALTATGRGQEIRAALADASDAAKAIVSQAWGPINSSQQPADFDVIRAAFGNVDSGLSQAEIESFRPPAANIPDKLVEPGTPAQPPQPTGLLDASGNPLMRPGTPEQQASGMQPFNEVTGLRSVLATAQREAASSPGGENKARVIGQYIDALDGYMDNAIPDSLRGQYDAAKAATRDFKDRFDRPQTAIAQTLAERQGMPATDASVIPGKFVQDDQGRIADFEALMREAGSDERVTTAVRDQILQDVKDRGLLDKPEALNDYLGQYGTVFGKFPALKTELGNAGSLRTALDQAQETAATTTQNLTQQGKSAVANYLTYGDEKAEQAMKGVLASRDPAASIDELISFVGDAPDAVNGARKVFWDIMQGKSRAGGRTTMTIDGAQPWSPKALSDFLDNPTNAAVAERLYRDNPEHLTRIREIAEALKGVDVRNTAKAPNTSGTAQGLTSQLLTPEALQSRAYAYMSGRISGTFLVTSIASVLVRRGVRKAQEQGYQRMLDDILTNADTAALVMKNNNPANRAALAKKAKLWFGNEASTIVNAMSSEDEADDTTAAAMRPEALN